MPRGGHISAIRAKRTLPLRTPDALSALTIVLPLLIASCSHAPEPNIASDDRADVSVEQPMYEPSMGPVVGVDSQHNNYHRIDGLFAPFASLLRNDGFRVVDSSAAFDAETLSGIDILVISNARSAPAAGDEAMPPPSAFAVEEIDAVSNWILKGGSLLLIADHAPFAGSAAELAKAFGFQFENVLVSRIPRGANPDIFSRKDGSLRPHIVTNGRDKSEAVNSVYTFGGSAFRAPGAQPIIVLPDGYYLRECRLPCPDTAPKRDASGYLQGAVLAFDKGRVAVFAEAAMFSAQVTPQNSFRFGFNAPGADENKQLVLNVLRWLAKALQERHPGSSS